ncbi:MAG TPA: aspartate aminotransferase family protein [Alphaproteobacteria bacterium]|nr:aspartate aminotransferase family protein [Alphaproteobacteria bacterium]
MSHVLGRQTKKTLPTAVRGEGIYLFDATGKRYVDASGGAAVSCLGHGHPEVTRAIKDQLDKLAYAHTGFFTNQPQEELADHLVAKAPAELGHAYFVSGGSEAMEAALKLARQYAIEIGASQRKHVISRWSSYHGNTLGALSAGGNRARRAAYEPLLIDIQHISPCFAYRGKRADESDDAYGARVANELEAKILELGRDAVLAFVAETVVGATIGAVPPVPGYFKRIREICERYGVLLVLDEVMCGMGRTGTLYAFEQEGIVPDIVTMAKGLGAGYQPIGAMLVADKIYDAIAGGSGAFMHGHTYMGHPVACAAALAVQQVMARDRLVENVNRMGAVLEKSLLERFGNHRNVGDIRGRGLFWAIELVEDRASKRPFEPKHQIHARIKAEAFARGMLCYPMGGTVDGKAGDHVLLAPPFIVERGQVEEIVDRLGTAVDAVLGSVMA